MCVNHLCVCASMHLRMYIFISTNKEGVGGDGSPEGFDCIGGEGTAEFTIHILTNMFYCILKWRMLSYAGGA